MSHLIAKSVKCHYVASTNSIKSSNFSMSLDTLNAYSYDWWLFCTKVNGKVIFNNTTYSQTTSKHQSKAMKVLNYKADLFLKFTRVSLSNLVDALNNEIENTRLEIINLKGLISNPRTHKAKNLERANAILELEHHIKLVERIKAGA